MQGNVVALYLVFMAVSLDGYVLAKAFNDVAYLGFQFFVRVVERAATRTLTVYFACHTRLHSVRFVAGAPAMGLIPGH